jgi:molybdopterin/thiamine biosynthesis adenylyltransferase
VLGVFAPVVGTIGMLEAHEALKLLAGIAPSLAGSLLMFDGRRSSFDTMRVARDPGCKVCGHRPAAG